MEFATSTVVIPMSPGQAVEEFAVHGASRKARHNWKHNSSGCVCVISKLANSRDNMAYPSPLRVTIVNDVAELERVTDINVASYREKCEKRSGAPPAGAQVARKRARREVPSDAVNEAGQEDRASRTGRASPPQVRPR